MMDKIEWSESYDGEVYAACVGNIGLTCHTYHGKWYARVRVGGIVSQQGPVRNSVDKAKEDAVDLAKNMLEDLMYGLKKEMASFGIKDIWDE